MRKDKVVKLIVSGALLALAVLYMNALLSGSVVHYKQLPSQASVKAVGVGVYWDLACSNETTEIMWGMIEPNQTLTVTVYVLGTGNTPVSLSMHTKLWDPPNASSYIWLKWDLEGTVLEPNQVSPAQLALTCSLNVTGTGITDFSFVIVIVGSG